MFFLKHDVAQPRSPSLLKKAFSIIAGSHTPFFFILHQPTPHPVWCSYPWVLPKDTHPYLPSPRPHIAYLGTYPLVAFGFGPCPSSSTHPFHISALCAGWHNWSQSIFVGTTTSKPRTPTHPYLPSPRPHIAYLGICPLVAFGFGQNARPQPGCIANGRWWNWWEGSSANP